eukprot:4885140-Heterocapsa_arctica.AAC.2
MVLLSVGVHLFGQGGSLGQGSTKAPLQVDGHTASVHVTAMGSWRENEAGGQASQMGYEIRVEGKTLWQDAGGH